jgi:hypothetical protein
MRGRLVRILYSHSPLSVQVAATVCLRTPTQWPIAPAIIAARRDVETATNQAQRKDIAATLQHTILHFDSFAKETLNECPIHEKISAPKPQPAAIMKQQTFASLEYNGKKKQTHRERFLAEMEQAVPWSRLLTVIAPYYHKTGQRGGQPKPLEAMLRIHLLQQRNGLSDPGMEDALYEIESMRRFAGLNLWDDQLPDETLQTNSAIKHHW